MSGERPNSISKIKVTSLPQPSLSDENDARVPSVGNHHVYPMTGDYDRPWPSYTTKNLPVYTLPLCPAHFGLPSGTNPGQIDSASHVRYGLASRPLRTEMQPGESPGYVFGDVSVDPSIVQNVDNIVWSIGSRNGISSRVMNRNIVNSCK